MKKLIGVMLSGVILLSGGVFISSYNKTQEELKKIEKDIEVERTIDIQIEYKEVSVIRDSKINSLKELWCHFEEKT